VEGQLVSATDTCVSVATQAAVDGPVHVELTSAQDDRSLRRVFRGAVLTPGSKLAVVTSQFERLLEAETTSQDVHLTILVDDPKIPGEVVFYIEPSKRLRK